MRLFLLLLFLNISFFSFSQNKALVRKIKKTPNMLALWTFKKHLDSTFHAQGGASSYPLHVTGSDIRQLKEGPLSGSSILLNGSNYLSLAHHKTGRLNIYGPGKQVTVLAWVKWSGEGTDFIG